MQNAIRNLGLRPSARWGNRGVHGKEVKKNKSVATICATSLDNFLDGAVLHLVAYGASRVGVFIKLHGCRHRCESRPPNDVVATAKTLL